MAWKYSALEGGEVQVDEHDTVFWCDECDKEFDLEDEGGIDGEAAFCEDCYNNVFGGKY